jgi:hypothetical protein
MGIRVERWYTRVLKEMKGKYGETGYEQKAIGGIPSGRFV